MIKDMEDASEFTQSLVPIYFGDSLYSIVLQGFNISFGIKEEGYYSQNNYTTFSFLTGMGEPEPEQLSTFVKAFAFIGLGTPITVVLISAFVLSTAWCGIKCCPRESNSN